MPKGVKKPVATLRKNNRMMMTMKIDVHIGKEEAFRTLLYQQAVFGRLPLTEAEALEMIQESVMNKGISYDGDDTKENEAKVRTCVALLFPELT